jgi:ketosteroid isomerase-like protein
VISPEQADELARAWVDAFNRHDLDAVLSHYDEDVEFSSPAVIDVTREHTGTLKGKAAVRDYFERALKKYPDLGFELLHILTGVDSVTILYRSLHRGTLGAEVMTFNDKGKVSHAVVHYAAQ